MQKGKPVGAKKKKSSAGSGKRFVVGCLASFGCSVFILVVMCILILVQIKGGNAASMSATFGMSPAKLRNVLVYTLDTFLILFIFTTFITLCIGLFKTALAKKDDKAGKRKGIATTFSSFLMLFIMSGLMFYIHIAFPAMEEDIKTGPLIKTTPADVTNLTAPITVEFDATNIKPLANSKIIQYRWTFGDGGFANSKVVKHTYERKGDGRYSVTLLVTHFDLTTQKEQVQRYDSFVIISNEKVKAVIEADVLSGPAPLTVNFDASQSKDPDGEVVSYEWDLNENGRFGDADDSNEITAQRIFERIGTYKIKLRVVDNSGEEAFEEVEIRVLDSTAPTAEIDIKDISDNKLVVGKNYVFSADKSNPKDSVIEKYEWDFGVGGKLVKAKNITFSYDDVGSYMVTLTVTNQEGETSSVTNEVVVDTKEAAPEIKITTTPERDEKTNMIEGRVPLDVIVDLSKSVDADDNIVEYRIDFDGDGNYDTTNAQAVHKYIEPGVYNMIVTVTDAHGNESTEIVLINALSQGLTARLSSSPVQGVLPLTVQFDASGSSYPEGEIVGFRWKFDDGSPTVLDTAKVLHKFTSVGTYQVEVEVLTSDNKKDTTTQMINVLPIPLASCFTPSRVEGVAPLKVVFNANCSQGTVQKYFWEFGDGGKSYERRPVYIFQEPGVYSVSLEVADNSNSVNTYSQTITVIGVEE